MSNIELIDQLCEIAGKQSALIKRLSLFIAEMNTVDEETKKTFADECSAVDNEIGKLEKDLGPIIESSMRKGENDG